MKMRISWLLWVVVTVMLMASSSGSAGPEQLIEVTASIWPRWHHFDGFDLDDTVEDFLTRDGPGIVPRWEFRVMGPFFQAGMPAGPLPVEPLTIVRDNLPSELELQRLSFYRGGSLLLRIPKEDGEWYPYINMVGVCLSSRTEVLEVLVRSWDGGRNFLKSVYYDSSSNTIGVREFSGTSAWSREEKGIQQLVKCAEDELMARPNVYFRSKPCTCDKLDYWIDARGLMKKLNNLVRSSVLKVEWANFEGGDLFPARDVPLASISDWELSSLLQEISQFAGTTADVLTAKPKESEGVSWARGLSIETYKSPAVMLVVVTLDSIALDDNAQLLLIRQSDQQVWQPIDVSALSSKTWIPAGVQRFVDDETVALDMCVETCSHWGQSAVVELNLRTLSGRISSASIE